MLNIPNLRNVSGSSFDGLVLRNPSYGKIAHPGIKTEVFCISDRFGYHAPGPSWLPLVKKGVGEVMATIKRLSL